MKKTDIKADGKTEYAVTGQDYGRAGQAAGDRGLHRAVVLAIGPSMYGRPGKATVKYLDEVEDWSRMRPPGHVADLQTRNVVALWSEHVVAKQAREEAEQQKAAAAEIRKRELEIMAQQVRSYLPADLVPDWLAEGRVFRPDSGRITVGDLLRIIEHARATA